MEEQIQLTMIAPLTHITQEQKLLQSLALLDPILTTLFILAACMVRRCTIVARAGSIGRPRRAVAASCTTCTSSVAASAQARTTASSTTVEWCVAFLACSRSEYSFSSGSQELFKDFANAKYLEEGAKIPDRILATTFGTASAGPRGTDLRR